MRASTVRMVVSVACFAAALGCTVRLSWPEHEVRLLFQSSIGESLHTVVGEATELRIDSLLLTATAIELLPCGWTPTLFGVGVANAHSVSETTTRVGVRHVQVLDRAVELASFAPPEDEYCGVNIEWGPTEDGTPTIEILGARRIDSGDEDGEWSSFTWTEAMRGTTTIDFEKPLRLGPRSESVELQLRANPVEWFADSAMRTQLDDEPARTVLFAAITSLELSQ